jgi:chromosome segregation ATPase
MKEEKDKEVTVNKETIDILVANVIPTTKYFESRFDFMQHQIDEIKIGQKDLKEYVDIRFDEVDKRFEQIDRRFEQIDRRFEQVDKRFEQVDKRFEQVDKRFEQVDKRFQQVDNELKEVKASINKLSEEVHNLALSIKESDKKRDVELRDLIIDRDRYYDRKFNNLRMFNIALLSLMAGIVLKISGILDKFIK